MRATGSIGEQMNALPISAPFSHQPLLWRCAGKQLQDENRKPQLCAKTVNIPQRNEGDLFTVLVISSDTGPEPVDEDKADDLLEFSNTVTLVASCSPLYRVLFQQEPQKQNDARQLLREQLRRGRHQIARRQPTVLVYSLHIRLCLMPSC